MSAKQHWAKEGYLSGADNCPTAIHSNHSALYSRTLDRVAGSEITTRQRTSHRQIQGHTLSSVFLSKLVSDLSTEKGANLPKIKISISTDMSLIQHVGVRSSRYDGSSRPVSCWSSACAHTLLLDRSLKGHACIKESVGVRL